ncbi:hypothetical protein [Desulfovibrio sp. UCD-KL4C]|uniref:hypothetical protein n=1 Tax=Desulfovibrio sp. UCD-KL4C TaxID=2578120 RepID=UPI0025BB007F|nr:hypothetical protein [Desulfovibrio sp. UCD-KL4C]
MWKKILIILAIFILTGLTIAAVNATERQTENELSTSIDNRNNNSRSTSQLTGKSIITNSFTLSDGINAGFLFGLDSNIHENEQKYTPEKKGLGLGLGFSFSF